MSDVRVMKARAESVVGCGHLVRVGEHIVKVGSAPFICLDCRLREIAVEGELSWRRMTAPSGVGAGT